VVVPGGPGRLAQHVADLERLRAELGVDEWVLFGSSLGGAVALEYALAHPTSTAGLVLVGTPVSWRFYEDPGSIYSPTHPDAWREEEARRALDGSDGAGRAWLETVLGPAARTRALREFAARARVSAAGLSALRAELLADPPWDLEPRLPEISCPVLVVAGRRDAEVPLREAETLAARLPHARLAVFDASARPAEEEPERFRAEVSAFLEAVETRRGQQEAPGA
jgi:pimeloyl-ACP methyl ester carboxylesterase